MKEMTTAEFAKANLADLAEPVSVRRYTRSIGVYYPNGTEQPVSVIDMGPEPSREKVEALRRDLEIDETAQKRIAELEDEVKRLKRDLAARGEIERLPVIKPKRSDDPFANLAKQDREFFERKLGGPPRKK